MKVYDWAQVVYEQGNNPRAVLKVETMEIKEKYGHWYDDTFAHYCGVDGRISDIPAYLGNYEVKQFWYDGKTYYCTI